MYAAPGQSQEEVIEAYKRMATRPAGESGTPKPVDPTPCSKPASECRLVVLDRNGLKAENDKYKIEAENTVGQINDLTAKLMVASGVTAMKRDEELLLRLQRIHTGMQNNIENLEAEAGHLRAQVKFLEKLLKDHYVTYEPEEWTEFRPPVKSEAEMAEAWAAMTGGDGTQL